MHDVAHMGLETGLATCHGCQNGLDTASHDHVVLWAANAAE